MADMDLIDWSVEELRRLISEPLDSRDRDSPASLNTALDIILKNEVAPPSKPSDRVAIIENTNTTNVEIANDGPPLLASVEIAARKTDDAPQRPMSGPAAAPISAKVHKPASTSPLKKAIVEPDIHVNPTDRERAIFLRWVLRDIKNKRLKLSPVDPRDLQALIDMGFVELLDDTPVLTGAGLSVVI